MPKDNLDLEAVVQAVDEVKSGFEQFKEAAKQREDELLKKGDVDPLIEEKLQRINADLDEKQAVIDKLYAAGRRKSITLDGQSVTEEELDTKAYQWATLAAKRRDQRVESFTHDDQLAYKTAQNAYLRKGDQLLTPDEAKALSVGSDPDGGYVVDPDTSGRLIKKIFETSPVRQYASVQVISTDALEGLRDLDETTFGWVGETSSRVETSTPQLEKWRIPVHEMYAEPRATQKFVDDMAIALEDWLADKVADKFARAENTAFVNGTGVDQPRGFLTYPAGTTNPGQVQQQTTGADGAFGADPDGGDALINMIHALKSQYRANGVFAMNRTTLGAVRLLKDSQGRMLWQPSLAAGMPSTLLGYPLASFEDMPDYTTTDAQAIIFADFGEFYQIVDRLGIRTLRDPYTAKPYIKYYSTKRVGGDVANFEAAVTLKFGS